jgi:hypothetical protein
VSNQDARDLAAPAAAPAREAVVGRAAPAEAPVGVAGRTRLGRIIRRTWVREVLVLAGFLAAGVLATWPRAYYFPGQMPLSADQSQYVWSLWWVAHQVAHLSDPWYTTHLAAPVGVQMGLDTLMPLLGVLTAPITLIFGPGVSYNLLIIVAPGLAGYAMYRAARLWLPGLVGPVAAGLFYGTSGMLASQVWLHLHTAMGCVFLPLTLEVTVRLRRRPRVGLGVLLGVVLAASLLVDQEFAALSVLIAVVLLIPWLLALPTAANLRVIGAGALTAAVISSPQLYAIAKTFGKGGTKSPPNAQYIKYAAEFPSLIAPSPRLANYGMSWLASGYSQHVTGELVATFGVVLTVMAVFGLVVAWRRPAARWLAVLWLGSSWLALGPTLYIAGHDFVPLAQSWHGLRVSMLMPYTWLIRVPGLSLFREADRLALLGLVGACLLAGAAVEWLRRRAWPALIVVAILGALEAGYPGQAGTVIVPTQLPAVDHAIAADHSRSVVVDVPFEVRGPNQYGRDFPLYALELAAEDGHPRGDSYTSGVPSKTINGIKAHPFYATLVALQQGQKLTPASLAAARADLRTLHVGWVLLWSQRWTFSGGPGQHPQNTHFSLIRRFLAETGFRLDYTADGVSVYRASPRT